MNNNKLKAYILCTVLFFAGGNLMAQRGSEPVKAYNIDFNWGEGGAHGFARPGLWADADPREHVEWYAAMGCDVIQSFAVSCNGYAWYRSGFVPEQPGLRHDFLTELVKLGRRRKMEVFGYFCVGANNKWEKDHPDLCYQADGWQIPLTRTYIDYLCASIADALEKTDMDGFMLDWFYNPFGRWLPCEQEMYRELLGEDFPGKDGVSDEKALLFKQRAIERAWQQIKKTARGVKPGCKIWLTASNVDSEEYLGNNLLKEVDMLMNEAGDVERTERMKKAASPDARLITCLANWNGQDPLVVAPDAARQGVGLFGFVKPVRGNMMPPVEYYLSQKVDGLKGDDRNIAVLARIYNGLPMDYVLPVVEDLPLAAGEHEPYRPVNGSFTGTGVELSPDPLVAYRWDNPQAGDSLQIFALRPQSVKADRDCAVIVNNTAVEVSGECNLMFDFGRNNAGWLEFDSEDLDGEVEMSISEFNEPAVFNPGSQHPVKTRRPEKYGSTYRLELNNTLYEGVRYAWIHVKELRGTAMLKNIRLICQVKPVNYQGSFACSDNMLTRIWYTGAYTVKLNLLHDYLGAILMERSDRHSWTGDAHTSQAAALVAFGNRDFVKMNIRHTSRQSNGIASYALYWTLSVADYFNYSRDADLVEEMRDNLCGKLDEAYRHFDNLPGLSFYGWDERLGAGFENPDCRESQNAYRMLCIWAWRECAEMLRHVGHEDLADKYRKYAAEKVDRLRASGPGWTSEFGVHAAADAIKAGFADEREAGELWKNAFSDRQNRLSYSPFNQYFIIQAMAVMKRYDEALTTIDDLWGGQIRYGGTTFFEDYRPSWNIISGYNDAPVNNQCGYTSFCHPWSAGVTKWISEEVLGIKPVEPGFRKFVFKPNLGNRLTWVKGTVPTPYGAIEAFYDKRTGEYSLVVPPGIEGEFVKPDDAGEYREEPFVYALKSDFREDNVTGGSWVGKYGSQGYILCNYDDAGHVVKLPGFITNADVNKEEKPLFKNGVSVHWASATQDRRALVSPGKRKERSLGAYTTRDANGWCQTMTVDLPSAKPYTLSIYFVDWERDGRRSAIEVFDLENMKLIAPVYMVRDYKEGKYVTFKVDRPVRIRVDQVRGKGAAVCGLFFDI